MVIDELIEIQEQAPESGLLQFRSLVSAQQYLPLYRTMVRYVAKGSTVLDWGSGNGHFAYFLARCGYETTAYCFEDIDIATSEAVHRRTSYTRIKAEGEDPVKLPFPDEQFEAVFSVGVLEHVRETGGNEAGSLQEIFRILKPDGLFICSHLPNRASFIEIVSSFFPGKHRHENTYTRRSVEALCREAGFDVLCLKRYGFLPRNIWGSFPGIQRCARSLAYFYNVLDSLLTLVLSFICQNFLFIAVKRRRPMVQEDNHTE